MNGWIALNSCLAIYLDTLALPYIWANEKEKTNRKNGSRAKSLCKICKVTMKVMIFANLPV